MAFKDLQFSIGKLKADVHSQIVKNNPLQKQDTKALSLWIFQERNDLASMRTVAYERTETIKALKEWVKEEVEEEKIENARDLDDVVGDKLYRLLELQIQVEQEYTTKYQQYRHAIKSIRDREDKLSDQREKKRSLQSRILNLSKSNARSPKLLEFQKELKSLQHDTLESEMDLADFKRFALKEAFYLRFNAMNEYAEKTALIAGFGRYLTDLLDIEPTPVGQATRKTYDKGKEAAIIFADAITAVKEWKPSLEDERPTLLNQDLLSDKKGKAPEVVSPPVTTSTVTAGPSKTPPVLPPRPQSPTSSNPTETYKPEQQSSSTTPVETPAPQPTGYTTQEISSVTGDLKTAQETEIDLERIDLYDAPPPGYYDDPASNSDNYSTLNAEHSFRKQTTYQQPDISFNSPFQAHLTAQTPNSPYQTHTNVQVLNSPYPAAPPPVLPQHSTLQSNFQSYLGSPAPSHAQLIESPRPLYNTPHAFQHQSTDQSSIYEQQQQMMYSHLNYSQLYRQVTQRYHQNRPYSEFRQQQIQRMDAGGFRIPVAPPPQLSAEDEKSQLARFYQQQDQYSFQHISPQPHFQDLSPQFQPAFQSFSPQFEQKIEQEEPDETDGKLAGETVEEPVKESDEKLVEVSDEKIVEESDEKSAEKSVEKSAEKSVEAEQDSEESVVQNLEQQSEPIAKEPSSPEKEDSISVQQSSIQASPSLHNPNTLPSPPPVPPKQTAQVEEKYQEE